MYTRYGKKISSPIKFQQRYIVWKGQSIFDTNFTVLLSARKHLIQPKRNFKFHAERFRQIAKALQDVITSNNLYSLHIKCKNAYNNKVHSLIAKMHLARKSGNGVEIILQSKQQHGENVIRYHGYSVHF